MIHDQRPRPAKKEAGMAILEIVLDLYVSVTPGVHTGGQHCYAVSMKIIILGPHFMQGNVDVDPIVRV